MIVIFSAVIGAVVGWRSAVNRVGNRLDIAQYSGVGAIIGALIGLFATIALERML